MRLCLLATWEPLGMRASTSYRGDFSGTELEVDDLLGQPDDYHRQPWFTGGSIRFAAVQLGGAEALWAATRSGSSSVKTETSVSCTWVTSWRFAASRCTPIGSPWPSTSGSRIGASAHRGDPGCVHAACCGFTTASQDTAGSIYTVGGREAVAQQITRRVVGEVVALVGGVEAEALLSTFVSEIGQ
jgi:hypothetical protein